MRELRSFKKVWYTLYLPYREISLSLELVPIFSFFLIVTCSCACLFGVSLRSGFPASDLLLG